MCKEPTWFSRKKDAPSVFYYVDVREAVDLWKGEQTRSSNRVHKRWLMPITFFLLRKLSTQLGKTRSLPLMQYFYERTRIISVDVYIKNIYIPSIEVKFLKCPVPMALCYTLMSLIKLAAFSDVIALFLTVTYSVKINRRHYFWINSHLQNH